MSPYAKSAINPFSRRNRPFTLFLMVVGTVAVAWLSGEKRKVAVQAEAVAKSAPSHHTTQAEPQVSQAQAALRERLKKVESATTLSDEDKRGYMMMLLRDAREAEAASRPPQSNSDVTPEMELWKRLKKFFSWKMAGPAAPASASKIAPSELKLKIISYSPTLKLATINDTTLAPGETAQMQLDKGSVKVECLEVTPDSATVRVDGGPTNLLHL